MTEKKKKHRKEGTYQDDQQFLLTLQEAVAVPTRTGNYRFRKGGEKRKEEETHATLFVLNKQKKMECDSSDCDREDSFFYLSMKRIAADGACEVL